MDVPSNGVEIGETGEQHHSAAKFLICMLASLGESSIMISFTSETIG